MIKRLWKRLRGFHKCPQCGEQSLQWVKDWLLFPDEPPILYHWECTSCNVRSDVQETSMATEAAKQFGYSSFIAAIEDKME